MSGFKLVVDQLYHSSCTGDPKTCEERGGCMQLLVENRPSDPKQPTHLLGLTCAAASVESFIAGLVSKLISVAKGVNRPPAQLMIVVDDEPLFLERLDIRSSIPRLCEGTEMYVRDVFDPLKPQAPIHPGDLLELIDFIFSRTGSTELTVDSLVMNLSCAFPMPLPIQCAIMILFSCRHREGNVGMKLAAIRGKVIVRFAEDRRSYQTLAALSAAECLLRTQLGGGTIGMGLADESGTIQCDRDLNRSYFTGLLKLLVQAPQENDDANCKAAFKSMRLALFLSAGGSDKSLKAALADIREEVTRMVVELWELDAPTHLAHPVNTWVTLKYALAISRLPLVLLDRLSPADACKIPTLCRFCAENMLVWRLRRTISAMRNEVRGLREERNLLRSNIDAHFEAAVEIQEIADEAQDWAMDAWEEAAEARQVAEEAQERADVLQQRLEETQERVAREHPDAEDDGLGFEGAQERPETADEAIFPGSLS